jgi:hypothetical protein
MDSFRNDHKGHMIFSDTSGPDSGPWVGSYSVWGLNDRAKPYSVLTGIAVGTSVSTKFASDIASEQARWRIDALLELRDCHEAAALRKPRELDISEFRNQ